VWEHVFGGLIVTTNKSSRTDGNAGALRALDQAELAGVDGGLSPDVVIDLRPGHLGTTLVLLAVKLASLLP
jgi:hypothetical protein